MTIIQFIHTHLNIGLNSHAELPFKITEQTFAAGQIITACGQREKNAYFLKSGIVQISMLYNGDERILDFIFENNFFGAYTSLLTNLPSDTQLTTLAKTEVEVIDYRDLQNAYQHSLLANQLGRYVTERLFINYSSRQKDLLTKTAEQRYLELFEKRPDIISVIPVNKIAKYLGIHPESLSRIRKSIIF
ncbi:MAG: Crp/Fnr family transcriptional regulator [Rhizobacter sp.]|nr:Crp/Fnr family transcriptional regulator [Ferruginibacter sp.]